jgi:hypothetical protein
VKDGMKEQLEKLLTGLKKKGESKEEKKGKHNTKKKKRPQGIPIKDTSYQTGKILEMRLDESDGIVPKDGYESRRKYFVVLGEYKNDSVIGVFLINSDVNKNSINTKELIDCQFPLKEADYETILDYDSYLDCSEIMELSKIKINTLGAELGQLTDSDKGLVIDTIEKSEVIPPKQKRKFGFEDKS